VRVNTCYTSNNRSWDIAYYTNADGDTPVVDWLLSLPEKERIKCMQYIDILMENGPRLTSQYAKHIESGIWELRPEFGCVENRLFYFAIVHNLIVILHGCKKPNGDRAFRREYAIAESRKKELNL
jgi:phage-related protein